MPRAVPHQQVFPVTARFDTESGVALQLVLKIRDGKLEHLGIDTVGEPEEPLEEIPDRWPSLDEVQYLIEGPDGTGLQVSPNPPAQA
ncbi:hypothetical protein [Arthrobacter globiformis]|uniref:hypothetical protein n=1 Tax=Arthrobacter globiformis TaxID=1665 RepID=UPI0011B94C42|nr:hypothetical protein [Arthrobacter globiformis]